MNLEILLGSGVLFVFRLMCVVIFCGAFIWAGNVITTDLKTLYHRVFFDRPLRRRSKLAIESARKVGKVAVFNQEKGITAVCLRRDFNDALLYEKAIIEKEGDEETKLRMSLSPIMVMPRNTFTFADPAEGNQFLTGTDLDAEVIFNAMIKKVTGYSRSELSVESFKYIRQILVSRDRRLLVPFVKEGHLPNGELMLTKKVQVNLFGGIALKEARKTLLSF